MIVGIVSGYFNPLHRGHIEYMNAARNRCDYLIAIVNSDAQVKIKGSFPFMDEQHRLFIVKNLKAVSEAIISVDKDRTVCDSIRQIYYSWPDTEVRFFNSGDRVGNAESAEVKLCERLGIEYVTLPLPKVCSSSELIKSLPK